MSWQPSQGGVQQIVSLLTDFQSPGADQHKVLAQLDDWCRSYPDFNNYLAFIFAHGESLPVEVRQGSGLLLKNNLRSQASSSTTPSLQHRTFIKIALLEALRLPERALRHTAGTCIVTTVGTESGGTWPELTATLAQFLDSGDPSRVEGALDTLYKLWEETPAALETETPPGSGQRPSDALVPRALAHFTSPDAALRALAVAATNLAAGFMPPSLMAQMDVYIQGLFSLASDAAPAVRKAVCAGLVQLVGLVPERLEPQLGGIIEYMLSSSQDVNEEVAVEATEFWSAYPESGLDVGALRSYLPRLLPVLLKNMVYEEYDEEVADAEAEEESALASLRMGNGVGTAHRDRDSEIKPHVHSSSGHTGSGGGGGGSSRGDDQLGEGEGEGDNDDDEVTLWNLRRCSAAGLDMLSTAFGDELLPLLLPAVQARLAEADWRAREGAVLALGAVSEGCAGGLAQHVPGIVTAVLPGITDARPLVRCISCWTLTRYSRGLLDRAASGDKTGLDSVVAAVCARIGDHNRKVQEAACGGIASLLEEAGNAAAPYMDAILAALGNALVRYSRKTLRNAYDAITTVAESIPAALKTPAGASLIILPLFTKLVSFNDGDRDMLPLLECLGAVALAAGPHMESIAPQMFNRCVDLADRMHAAAASGAYDKEESDEFVVAALDAVCGLVEGLGAGVESLVARSALCEVLVECCRDENPDVRQSGFALVGELAKVCVPHLRPVLGEIAPCALANLEPAAITHASISACNNAAWSLGELAVVLSREEAAQFALPALERFARILSAPAGGLPRSLIENAAVSLGRIAWKCPETLAPHAAAFTGPWCAALRSVRDGREKEHAFLGLCALLRTNPDGANASFTTLCEAVVSWRNISSQTLHTELMALMQGYKERLVGLGQWDAALASLSPAAAGKLVTMCQLG